MSFTYSFFAAVVPMLIYLIFLWRLDKFEREPFKKVFAHFLWGAFGAVFFGIIISLFFNTTAKFLISNPSIVSLMGTVIIAPFVEEFVKGIYLLHTYSRNFFDNLTDGLVYGGAIGLGFGMTENLLYFTIYNNSFEQWISIVLIRSVFSAVMHAIATAALGMFLAKLKFGLARNRKILVIYGFLIAVAIHAVWNFSMSFDFTFYLGIIFMILIISGFLMIFLRSLESERKLIETQLRDELVAQIVHYDSRKRRFILQQNTIEENDTLRSKKIINFATKLAFRKLQAENSTGSQKESYNSEIVRIRMTLDNLLEKS